MITPSCKARRIFACAFRARSPISSRKSVPPLAALETSGLIAGGASDDPFMWPNSSLSTSSLGIAAQLTSTNGPRLRADPS